MDTLKQLPEEYFDNKPYPVNYGIEGSDYSLSPETVIENDDTFKMPGEETSTDSVEAIPYKKQNNQNIKEDSPTAQTNINDSESIANKSEPFNNNNEEILNQIKNIDDKLFELEKQLYTLDNSVGIKDGNNNLKNNTINNNLEMVSREIPLETNKENVQNIENNNIQQIDADHVTNDSLSNLITNENQDLENNVSNDIVEVQNKNYSKKDLIKQEVKNLNIIRKELITKLKKETNNLNNTSNNRQFNQNSFIPNLAPTTDTEFKESIDRAVESEKIFNNNENVKLVSDDFGNPAVISENQINLQQAIEDHGGANKGIKDSIEKQNFTENISKFDNSELNSTDNVFNTSSNNVNLEDSIFNETYPDNFSDISKNTEATVIAVNSLSKKISELSKSIANGFKGLNGSIKNIENTQNNMVNNYGDSTTGSSRPQSNMQKNGSTIPNVGGDTPLPQDFPEGFIPGGSNL